MFNVRNVVCSETSSCFLREKNRCLFSRIGVRNMRQQQNNPRVRLPTFDIRHLAQYREIDYVDLHLTILSSPFNICV